MSRSSNAAHYGSEVEAAARERYNLEEDYASWHDATRRGDPVEIKAAMHKRESGSPGRFRIFEDYHDRLARADGYYVFGVYRPRGRGVEIVSMTLKRARALRLSGDDFYSAGGHRDSRQIKIPIGRIF